jgi:hypothetical protein
MKPSKNEKGPFKKKHRREGQPLKKKESALTVEKRIISPGNVGRPKLIPRSPKSKRKRGKKKSKEDFNSDKE